MRYGANHLLPDGLNHQAGRFGETPVAVVVHMMLGRMWGTDSHFRNPDTGASTHFGIGWANLTDERNDTRCHTWQWVDTDDTAWGWSAKPTKSPTPLARSILNLITPDLNRQVIHVELANFGPTPATLADWYGQPFRDSQYDELARLLHAISEVHGNLALLGHSDCSTKLCPGTAIDWNRIGGGHGGLLTQNLPDTAIPEIDVDFDATTHQIPKIVRIRTGATLYKQPIGPEVHWTVDQAFDAELLLGYGNRFLCRRVGAGNSWWIEPDAIDRTVPYRLLTEAADCSAIMAELESTKQQIEVQSGLLATAKTQSADYKSRLTQINGLSKV